MRSGNRSGLGERALAVALLLISNAAGQSLKKPEEPSSEEKKALESVGRLPMFNWPGDDLRKRPIESKQPEYRVEGVGSRAGRPTANPAQDEDDLRQAACNSDVVAYGTVEGQTSALSSSGSAVVTLNRFSVKKLFKGETNASSAPLRVFRYGGVVAVPEGLISQIDHDVPGYSVGSSYVLFLRKLPGIEAYVSAEPDIPIAVSLEGRTMPRSLPGASSTVAFTSFLDLEQSLGRTLSECGGAVR